MMKLKGIYKKEKKNEEKRRKGKKRKTTVVNLMKETDLHCHAAISFSPREPAGLDTAWIQPR